jgi:outer membrane biosynthesis protein TonB
MAILETEYQRKSAIITSVILTVFLLVIFNFGLRYLDPPAEYGITINFGNSSVGNGDPIEKQISTPAPKVVEKSVKVEEEPPVEIPKEIIQEALITNDSSKEIAVLEKPKEVKTAPTKEVVTKEIKKEKPKPQPSKETQEALTNLLKGNDAGEKPTGEGNDSASGLKGNENGDPNANKYYGNALSGSDLNYNLAGRKALSKPIEKPECQQEGIVVVSITVDQNGNVISAIPGVKGTTNSSPCLLNPAREAALRTKWNADIKAPSNQKGTIIYKFTLVK